MFLGLLKLADRVLKLYVLYSLQHYKGVLILQHIEHCVFP